MARIATLDLELRPMLQRITDALARKFEWDFVALVTIDPEANTFLCEALTSTVPTSVYVGYGRVLGSGVVGHVASTGEPLLLDDVRDWPSYVETMPGAQSELCVPVHHHGRLVAILNLESMRLAAFHDQLPLLATVADQIAGAIASAQLYEESRRRERLMEMMSEVSRTALDATDLSELLDRIVRYIQERFPLALTQIVLANGELPPDASNERITVPIRHRGQLLGSLILESSAPDVFGPANVLAFEAFADQIAGAIHLSSVNARLAQTSTDLAQANEHLSTAIETLHRISTQDGLTGVSNRRNFDETLAIEWRRAARTRDPLALLMVDIDYFKAFNDTNGHQMGDECLRRVAQTLSESVHRAADLVSRYGGEEFAVLLPHTDRAQAAAIAEVLREKVASIGHVTVSIGVASVIPPRDGTNVEAFVGSADAALYAAKRAGRNRVLSAEC